VKSVDIVKKTMGVFFSRITILEGEPPEWAEEWTGPVMGVEAAEFSPALARVSPLPWETWETKAGVSPVPGKPAEIPRRAAAPPG
jgi:hypothetical protein